MKFKDRQKIGILKECDTGYSKDTCTPMFIAALFTIAKLWKQPRCPTINEWIKKLWYLYTMEYYSAMKKNEILSFLPHTRTLNQGQTQGDWTLIT
jgi:hypothetical protein